MQREIKFRGKRVDTKEWVYGYYYYDIDRNRHMIWAHEQYGEGLCDNTYEVIPETVGEYTGLKDKTGKAIYEGDIVVFKDMIFTESGYRERDCIGIVVWGEETAAFEVTNRLSAESYEVLSDCKVIGNIYVNPELLEN